MQTDNRGTDLGEGYARWRRDFAVRPEELQALGTGEAIAQVAPLGGRPRRLERVRIAQPRHPEPPPVAPSGGRTVLHLGFLKVTSRR